MSHSLCSHLPHPQKRTSFVTEIQPGIDPASCIKPHLDALPGLKQFLNHCCQSKHYSFKCGSSDCQICKPPQLPKEVHVFDTLHHISDPIHDSNVYKPFSDVYGTSTTEKDRPSLHSSAEKCGHGMPFIPSGQFTRNVAEHSYALSVAIQGCCMLLGNLVGKINKTWN